MPQGACQYEKTDGRVLLNSRRTWGPLRDDLFLSEKDDECSRRGAEGDRILISEAHFANHYVSCELINYYVYLFLVTIFSGQSIPTIFVSWIYTQVCKPGQSYPLGELWPVRWHSVGPSSIALGRCGPAGIKRTRCHARARYVLTRLLCNFHFLC